MRTLRYGLLLPVLALALSFSACDNTEDPAELSVNVSGLVNGTDLAMNQTYTIGGRTFTFTHARLYLSEIELLKGDGTSIRLKTDPYTVSAAAADGTTTTPRDLTSDDLVVFARHDADDETFAIGEIPAGRYTGLRFRVGINEDFNKTNAPVVASTNPLAVDAAVNNWWNWNSGYIFMRLDGQVDSGTTGDGTVDTNYQIHLGLSTNSRIVTLNDAFELEGGENMLHIEVDYGQLIAASAAQWVTPNNTTANRFDYMSFGGGATVATNIADTFDTAITIHAHSGDGHDH